MKMQPLYMAQDLKSLSDQYAVNRPEDYAKSDPTLFKFSEAMLEQANAAARNQDQERAYVLFIRYIDLVLHLKKNVKDTAVKTKLSGADKHIKNAFKNAEFLKLSLDLRYGELARAKENEQQQQKQEKKDHPYAYLNLEDSDDQTVPSPCKANGSPAVTRPSVATSVDGGFCSTKAPPLPQKIQANQFIEPKELYNLLYAHAKVLLIDIRSRPFFDQSHVVGDAVINVPEDVVRSKQLSVDGLEGAMNQSEKAIFQKRATYDYVVFIDRAGSQSMWRAMDNPLAVIMLVMTSRDNTGKGFTVTPQVLHGGYPRFAMMYPGICTNTGSFLGDSITAAPTPHIDFPTLPNDRMADLLNYQPSADTPTTLPSEPGSRVSMYPSIPTFRAMVSDSGRDSDVGECVSIEKAAAVVVAPGAPPPVNRASKPSEDAPPVLSPQPAGLGLPPRPPKPKVEGEAPPLPARPPKEQKPDATQATAPALPPKPPTLPARPEEQQYTQDLTLTGNKGTGLTGLKNMGNTCYMNSIIQCLSNTMPFSVYFIDGRYQKDINRKNPLGMQGQLATEFGKLLQALWSGRHSYIAPNPLKNVISKFAPRFAGSEQHDSQELLSFLMDGLHEDLNRSNDRRYIEDNYEGLPDAQAAKQAWANYRRRNDSVIVDLFQGMFRNRLKCLTCGYVSTTFNPFMYLSLPIPPKPNPTLKDCIDLFVAEEKVSGDDQWYCSKCKTHRDALKKIDIWTVPDILFVHFKRFAADATGTVRKKLDVNIDFPIRDLDLSSYIMGVTATRKFQLEGVSNHWGQMGSGHYTSYCKNVFDNLWYHFDDSVVSPVSQDRIRSAGAYVLHYSTVNTKANTR